MSTITDDSHRVFRKGLFPLSADPITNGHLDIIRQAAAQCDVLIVLVCDNDGKEHLFSLQERTEMTMRAVRNARIDRVAVVGSRRSLLPDFYLRESCDALFRGIRSPEDTAAEDRQIELHRIVLPDFGHPTCFLTSDIELVNVSSTNVKAFVRRDVDVSSMVPTFVKRRLEERIRGVYKVGVTGSYVSGKTYMCRNLLSWFTKLGIHATHINFDELIRSLYEEESPGAQNIRDMIARAFGDDCLTTDRKQVDRVRLRDVFASAQNPEDSWGALRKATRPHIERKYREAIYEKTGIILVEWALFAEDGLSHVVNHNMVVVDADRELVSHRGMPDPVAERMRGLQWTAEQKVSAIRDLTQEDGTGTVIRWKNEPGMDMDKLGKTILSIFPDMQP